MRDSGICGLSVDFLRPVGRLKEDVVKERVAIRLSPDVVVEFITMGEWLADPN
jgi:uncharacterized protein (DUF4415 family)